MTKMEKNQTALVDKMLRLLMTIVQKLLAMVEKLEKEMK